MTIFFPRTIRQRTQSAMEQERRRARLERKYAPKISRILRESAIAMSVRYAKGGGELSVLAEVEQAEAKMLVVLQQLYSQVVIATAKSIVINRRSIWEMTRKSKESRVDRLLQEWVQSRALRKARQISKTTREDIRGVISRGVEEGLGEAVIAKEIRKKAKEMAPHRALTIARTETHSAAQSSSLEIVKDLAVPGLKKQWVAVEDSRTRESHHDADGQVVGIDEKFKVGDSMLSFPGDPEGDPSETINCRCVMTYSI